MNKILLLLLLLLTSCGGDKSEDPVNIVNFESELILIINKLTFEEETYTIALAD